CSSDLVILQLAELQYLFAGKGMVNGQHGDKFFMEKHLSLYFVNIFRHRSKQSHVNIPLYHALNEGMIGSLIEVELHVRILGTEGGNDRRQGVVGQTARVADAHRS